MKLIALVFAIILIATASGASSPTPLPSLMLLPQ